MMTTQESDRTPPPLLRLSEHMRTLGRPLPVNEDSDSGEDMSLAAAVRGAGHRPARPPIAYQAEHRPPQATAAPNPLVNVVQPAISGMAPPRSHAPPYGASSSATHHQLSPPTASARPPFIPGPRDRPPLELLNHLTTSKPLPPPMMQRPTMRASAAPGRDGALPPGMMVAHLSDSGVPHVSVDHAINSVGGPPMSPMEKNEGTPRPPIIMGIPGRVAPPAAQFEQQQRQQQPQQLMRPGPMTIRPPPMNWPRAGMVPATYMRPGMAMPRPPFMFMPHQKGFQPEARARFEVNQVRNPSHNMNTSRNGDH